MIPLMVNQSPLPNDSFIPIMNRGNFSYLPWGISSVSSPLQNTIPNYLNFNSVFVGKENLPMSGQRYLLNNIDTYNNLNINLTGNTSSSNKISLLVWIRFISLPSNSVNLIIFNTSSASNNIKLSTNYSSYSNYLSCSYTTQIFTSSNSIIYDTWGHYACIINNNIRLITNNITEVSTTTISLSFQANSFNSLVIDGTSTKFFYNSLLLFNDLLDNDTVKSWKFLTNSHILFYYSKMVVMSLNYRETVIYKSSNENNIGDLYPVQCQDNEIFNGIYCDPEKILDICSYNFTQLNLISTNYDLGNNTGICIDFYIYLQKNSDVPYDILNYPDAFKSIKYISQNLVITVSNSGDKVTTITPSYSINNR